MASISLSSKASSSGSSKFTGSVEWSVLQTNATGAEIKVTLYCWITSGYTYATIDGAITAGGSTVASGQWGTIYSTKISAGETATVCSGTFWINFNSSGVASATISASATITNSGSFSGTISGSGTASANAPYGPSTITLGATSVQMGRNLLITLKRDTTDCTHTLSYKFGEDTGDIATDVGGSYGWTVPDLADKCNDALSGICTITCTTFLSGKSLGTTTADVTLTVQDPTTPALDGGGDEVTMGTACKVNCQRNSANFTMKLELEFQGITVSIAEENADSADWTPGYDLAKQIPNLTYATGYLKCTTLNGTAEVGTRQTTIRVIVPENDVTKPVFTVDGLTLSPVSSLPEVFAGLYMRGKTGIQAAFDATSEYSTIADYAVTVGSQRAVGNPAAIDLLISEGDDVKVTAKVTDARGYSTTVTTSIQVLPYQNPRVVPCEGKTSVICERATADGALSANGTYLAIEAGKRYSSVKLEGVEQNSCVLRYRWMPNGGAYCDWITLLTEDSEQTEVKMVVGNVVGSLQTSYMVQIESADALGGVHTLTFQIMTEAISFVLFDGPDGAGFGKYPEAAHVVDIASHMTLLCRGKLVVVSADWASLGLADGVSEAVYSYGKKKESGCHWNVANGNHVYVAFDCTFEYSGTRVVINSSAIPEEYRPHRETYVLCPVSNHGLALVSVDTYGYVWVEWVQNLTENARSTTIPVEWIDGYLDYWT